MFYKNNKMELQIQTEIQKHKTESTHIYQNDENVLMPTKEQFMQHIFTTDVQDRNKFHNKELLLKFKSKEGKEIQVCVWELNCSGDNFVFYGYTKLVYYGSGLYSDKEGYGMHLVSGEMAFDKDGNAIFAFLNTMDKPHR